MGGGGCYVVGNRDEGGGKEGRGSFLSGNVILHNAQDITGSRNCVDLFIHQNVVTLDEQHRKHKWGGDKMGKNKRQKKD